MDSAASCHRAGFQRIAERKIIFMDIYRKDSMATLVKDNAYVGRGIVIGKTADAKKAAVAYFIMGRSENSRNRVFIEKGDEVIIEPFDVSKVEDPSLIIYSPIKKWENKLIVTNGDQTDTVYDFIKDGKTFEEALETREFEPDAPNFTPRISPDDIDTFLNEIWENLNEQNKISIYVRYIDLETGAVENRMINKNK